MARSHELSKTLWENARNFTSEIHGKTAETSDSIAKEKTQFFEKISLGSGAIIAATVSFIASQKATLHPSWLLRCTLLTWLLTLIAGMLRNWRYQFYPLASLNRQLLTARRGEQQRKAECIRTVPYPLDIETGQPIDMQKFEANFKESDDALAVAIQESDRYEKRVWKQLMYIEGVTLSLAAIGMVGLLVLAWKNF